MTAAAVLFPAPVPPTSQRTWRRRAGEVTVVIIPHAAGVHALTHQLAHSHTDCNRCAAYAGGV
ncbi:hypothetical protein GCM10009559_03780 [Pseudonocardia zijingensis]|uniref:Uncharacterized protein n=1 Tax=Pseudonocardia zijingensis TaxID=153376 RepID=A0ABP3ZGD6_9PSEU